MSFTCTLNDQCYQLKIDNSFGSYTASGLYFNDGDITFTFDDNCRLTSVSVTTAPTSVSGQWIKLNNTAVLSPNTTFLKYKLDGYLYEWQYMSGAAYQDVLQYKVLRNGSNIATYNPDAYWYNNCGVLYLYNSQVNKAAKVNVRSNSLTGGFSFSTFDSFPLMSGTENVFNNIHPRVWAPFEQLNGNSGQFRMNLTQIKDEEIGDYTQTTLDSDGSKLKVISNQSSLLPFFQNILLGSEEKIAWAGQNYLTMKAELDSSVTAYLQYKITLKFYYLSGVEAYSQIGYIRYPNTTSFSTIYPYLSIIYDDENEVAVLDLVYYDINETPGVATIRRYMYGSVTWSTISPSDQEMYQLWVWLHGIDTDWESDDPYDTGSEDNGGDGGNPRPQDDIESPDVPSISGLDVGMVTIYNPSDTQLEAISDFLWTDNVIDNFKKYFNNFSDNIIGLYTLPYTPTNLPTKAFTVGKMTSETILNVPYLTARYVKINMGSYQVRPRWTSYLDYSPYTKIHIYLPGIGIQALDTDDIMSPSNKEGTLNENQGCLLELEYMLDLYTGLIVAFLYTTVEGRKSMKYQFSGKVGAEIPITGIDRTNMIKGLIGLGTGLTAAVVTGGLSAPMVAASPAVQKGTVDFGTKMSAQMSGAAGGIASSAVAGTVNAMKPEVHRSGNLTGDVSMMSYQTPYLIISSPNKPRLVNQSMFTGFPSYKSGKLNEFSGFTQVIEVHVEGIPCTEVEREMIISMLKEGVIL